MPWALMEVNESKMAAVANLLFVEHGLSPEPAVAWWQRCLTPCWSQLSGGCHLDLKTDDLITAVGFEMTALGTAYMRGPKPWTYMYQGSARTPRRLIRQEDCHHDQHPTLSGR